MGRVADSLKDKTEFYTFSEPISFPNVFPDGWFRVKSTPTCRKCGKKVNCVLRTHRWRSELAEYGIVLSQKAEDPKLEQVMAAVARTTEEHRTGNPAMHHPECPVGKMPRTGKMMLTGMSRRDH